MRSLLGRGRSTEPVAGMSLDDLCTLLDNHRRRKVIEWIDDDRRVRKRDLARQIASLEVGPDPDYNERKAVYVSLHQTHLPKLRRHGVVIGDDYLEAGPNHEAVLDALQELRGHVEVADA